MGERLIARIAKLYFGPEDKKSGGVLNGPKIFSHKQCHHKPEVFDEIGSSDSREILKEFFKSKRSLMILFSNKFGFLY